MELRDDELADLERALDTRMTYLAKALTTVDDPAFKNEARTEMARMQELYVRVRFARESGLHVPPG